MTNPKLLPPRVPVAVAELLIDGSDVRARIIELNVAPRGTS